MKKNLTQITLKTKCIRKIPLILLFILTNSILLAKQIDVNTARQAAISFLSGKTKLRNAPQLSLELIHTAGQQSSLQTSSGTEPLYYYVFNIGDNNGFIIISADDVNVPVIGYSKKGGYDPALLPENFKSWMKNVELGMADAILKDSSPRAINPGGELDTIVPVDALIKTQWDQGHPFNIAIPYLVNGTSKPATGCTATATAQVMKYYNYPVSGKMQTSTYRVGDASNPTYIPAIDLTQYTYDWEHMLNRYSGVANISDREKNAVAQLMYHVGASVRMDYGPSSGASLNSATNALIAYFGYDTDIFNIKREHYSNQDWTELIRKEIANNRPVIYEGWSITDSGHAFICDGFDENGLFHFNWGWGGYNDGYYSLDAPLEYKNKQQIVANIKPENGIMEAFENVVTSLSTDKVSYKKNELMTVNYTLAIRSNQTREYEVALYSMTGNLVSIVTYTDANGKKSHKIKADTPAGNYMVKIVEKLPSGEYHLLKQSPSAGGDKVITVKNEAINHSIYLTGLYTSEKTGYPGKEFDIQLNTGSRSNESVYIRFLLIDEQNNQFFINEPVLVDYPFSEENFEDYQHPSQSMFTCKIPDNIPQGTYKIQPIAREIDMNWDAILFRTAQNNYLDYEVFSDAAGYKVSEVISYKSTIKRAESFTIRYTTILASNDNSRTLDLKPALYDSADQLVEVMECIKESSGYSHYARTSVNIAPGEYKLKMVEQTDGDTYIPAPVSQSFVAKSILVTN
ncbi:MAG: C10 family peptidase [Dysgonomonas sp.]|nr:C10 family peptidase [Dysgonomonas sp.]